MPLTVGLSSRLVFNEINSDISRLVHVFISRSENGARLTPSTTLAKLKRRRRSGGGGRQTTCRRREEEEGGARGGKKKDEEGWNERGSRKKTAPPSLHKRKEGKEEELALPPAPSARGVWHHWVYREDFAPLLSWNN